MPFRCPICQTEATYRHNLITHLRGAKRRGGHGLDPDKAVRVAEGVEEHPAAGTSARTAAAPPGVLRRPPQQKAIEVPVVAPLADEAATGAYLRTLLQTLVAFKALPKYQFERRVDIFLVPFLPEILTRLLRVAGPIDLVLPEFPIKRPDSNQSTNADYLLFDRTPGHERWLLFELKTDDRSVGAEQVATYRRAIAAGMVKLVRDVDTILGATTQRAKYRSLVERLQAYPADRPVHLVYLSPASLDRELNAKGEHSFTFKDLLGLEVRENAEVWALLQATVIGACAGAE